MITYCAMFVVPYYYCCYDSTSMYNSYLLYYDVKI
jgi:hypothetical protein